MIAGAISWPGGYRSWQEIENDRNVADRRCRIGNVKPRQSGFTIQPGMAGHEWWKMFGMPFAPERKCSCLPYQACGNAACPHAMVAS